MSKDAKAKEYIVRAPIFPLYSHIKHCIKAWNGEKNDTVYGMIKDLFEQTGTPQNPVDWSDPDSWIDQRLSGESQRLAKKIWVESDNNVNPRHAYGCYLFIKRLKLLDIENGIYRQRARGEDMLRDDPAFLNELDKGEGIPYLLTLANQAKSFKFSDLLDNWSIYLQAVSKFSKLSVFKDTLRRRLLNLIERGLIERSGNRYLITSNGQKYLIDYPYEPEIAKAKKAKGTSKSDLLQTIQAYNKLQEKSLIEKLMQMPPFEFEHFIKELLVAMEYENVVVTKQSGDKGVDVVANFQFGITEITEVVQVKRTQTNIGRPVIDALRGALPYHKAIRGTIITLGGYVKGVEDAALFHGAAPITLIDGEQLIKLVVKHGIGIKRTPIDAWEVDEAFFEEPSEELGDLEES